MVITMKSKEVLLKEREERFMQSYTKATAEFVQLGADIKEAELRLIDLKVKHDYLHSLIKSFQTSMSQKIQEESKNG